MNPIDLHSQLETLHPGSFAWAVACCCGDRDQAADVLQTSYEKVLDGSARFGEMSTLKTWLFGVIRHTALEAARRGARRQRLGERLETEAQGISAEPGWASDHADVEAIALALDGLSPQQRQVVHLVFYEGMTVQEAGDSLEISVGTARQHYARAKQKLREQLQPHYAET